MKHLVLSTILHWFIKSHFNLNSFILMQGANLSYNVPDHSTEKFNIKLEKLIIKLNQLVMVRIFKKLNSSKFVCN